MDILSTIEDERKALAAVLNVIPELTVYPYWPDNIETPAALIRPVHRVATVMDGMPTRRYEIEVLQIVGDQESAQQHIDTYLEETGVNSIRALLEGNPTLNNVVGNLEYIGWSDYGGRKTEAASFIGAIITIVLYPRTDE